MPVGYDWWISIRLVCLACPKHGWRKISTMHITLKAGIKNISISVLTSNLFFCKLVSLIKKVTKIWYIFEWKRITNADKNLAIQLVQYCWLGYQSWGWDFGLHTDLSKVTKQTRICQESRFSTTISAAIQCQDNKTWIHFCWVGQTVKKLASTWGQFDRLNWTQVIGRQHNCTEALAKWRLVSPFDLRPLLSISQTNFHCHGD